MGRESTSRRKKFDIGSLPNFRTQTDAACFRMPPSRRFACLRTPARPAAPAGVESPVFGTTTDRNGSTATANDRSSATLRNDCFVLLTGTPPSRFAPTSLRGRDRLLTVRGRSGRHAKLPFRRLIAASQGDVIRCDLASRLVALAIDTDHREILTLYAALAADSGVTLRACNASI